MAKTSIVIAGIGGVGGYFGGLLAHAYEKDANTQIHFLARGEHLAEIQRHGLLVVHGEKQFVAHPHSATDDATSMGAADYIFVCTKSYDLDAILTQLQPCIQKHTLIIPLLNGVDAQASIQARYPNNNVLQGCVYLVARLKKAGVIDNTGNIQTLYFGKDGEASEEMRTLETILTQASIQATLSTSIASTLWEKFIFLSPTATATSYFDSCIGEILSNEESLKVITALIAEVIQLALAKGIQVDENSMEKTLQKLRSLPYETTSSMHADFKKTNAKTELETLTNYVIRESKKYQLHTPTYERLYEVLKRK